MPPAPRRELLDCLWVLRLTTSVLSLSIISFGVFAGASSPYQNMDEAPNHKGYAEAPMSSVRYRTYLAPHRSPAPPIGAFETGRSVRKRTDGGMPFTIMFASCWLAAINRAGEAGRLLPSPVTRETSAQGVFLSACRTQAWRRRFTGRSGRETSPPREIAHAKTEQPQCSEISRSACSNDAC